MMERKGYACADSAVNDLANTLASVIMQPTHDQIALLAYRFYEDRQDRIAAVGHEKIAQVAYQFYAARMAVGPPTGDQTLLEKRDWQEALNWLGCGGNAHNDWLVAEAEWWLRQHV